MKTLHNAGRPNPVDMVANLFVDEGDILMRGSSVLHRYRAAAWRGRRRRTGRPRFHAFLAVVPLLCGEGEKGCIKKEKRNNLEIRDRGPLNHEFTDAGFQVEESKLQGKRSVRVKVCCVTHSVVDK